MMTINTLNLPQDHYIEIDHLQTRFWVEGEGNLPVILLHGLGGFVESWLPGFHILAQHHPVYALDLPGHGRTDKPVDRSYQLIEFAHFVRDFLAAFRLERVCLVGHSLGGAIAAQFTLLFPSLVQKLVLVSSGGLGPELGLGLRLQALPILGEILSLPVRPWMERGAHMLVYDPACLTPELIELGYRLAILPGAARAHLQALRANVNWLGQRPCCYGSIVQGLSSIAIPVLVIWGRQDQLVPVTHAQVARQRLPNIQVRLLENCGHIPMLEQPQVFSNTLCEFLGG